MTTEEKITKNKLGLIKLAKTLGNISLTQLKPEHLQRYYMVTPGHENEAVEKVG